MTWSWNIPRPSVFSYHRRTQVVEFVEGKYFEVAVTTSWSPSPSKSKTRPGEVIPPNPVPISCATPKDPAPSEFGNHTSSSDPDSDSDASTSKSPSPSTSPSEAQYTPRGRTAMVCPAANVPAPSVFSYHATVSSTREATRTSMSPSPSKSAARAELGPSAESVTRWEDPKEPPPSVFSYQATVSSSSDATSTSWSPSPSRSAVTAEFTPSTSPMTTCRGPKVPAPLVFSNHTTSFFPASAASTSWSPSPSRSAACTCRGRSRVAEMMRSGPKLPMPFVLSYHASLLSLVDAESTSWSPSPSRSTAKTDAAPSAVLEMIRGAPQLPSPSVFSYQAISSVLLAAETTS